MRFENILAVIDPTTDNQRALHRAIRIASATGARVHAYLCGYSRLQADDVDALQRAGLERYRLWLDHVVKNTDCYGLEVIPTVEWDPDWREALAPAAEKLNCDLIVKSTYRRSAVRRRLLTTADMRLLRTAKCPVSLVKRESGSSPVDDVLLALNIGATDESHARLNEKIIDAGHSVLARNPNARLHAVNAYSDSDYFIHPPDLAHRVGIPRERCYVALGAPEKVIAETATKLNAGLVIIGTVARRGITGVAIGNTAERVLDQLDDDVMVLVG